MLSGAFNLVEYNLVEHILVKHILVKHTGLVLSFPADK